METAEFQRDGFWVALFQALRARLRSHRPSGTLRRPGFHLTYFPSYANGRANRGHSNDSIKGMTSQASATRPSPVRRSFALPAPGRRYLNAYARTP
jgi:hypothetical protein